MIPENIKQLANKVRNEIYGRDVRESIAQSMEVSGETSNEANERSKDTAGRQTDVENRFDDQIAGNTDIDEVIDARRPEGGESYPTLRKRLDDEHNEVTAQLAQTTDELNTQNFYSGLYNRKQQKGMFTWVDDDGNIGFYNRYKSIMEEFGVRFTAAIYGTNLGKQHTMTEAQVREMIAFGCEIVSHGYDYDSDNRLLPRTDEEYEKDVRLAWEFTKNIGGNTNHYVIPFGESTPTMRNILSKYHVAAYDTTRHINGGTYNTVDSVDNMWFQRVSMNSPIKHIKEQMLEAKQNNGWIILMSHVNSDGASDEKIREILQYRETINLDYGNLDDGFNRFGNLAQLSPTNVITADGEFKGKFSDNVVFKTLFVDVPANAPIDFFEREKVTYFDVNSPTAQQYGLPTAGTIKVIRTFRDDYSHQVYQRRRSSQQLIRFWITDEWGEWLKYSPFTLQTTRTINTTIGANSVANIRTDGNWSADTVVHVQPPKDIQENLLWNAYVSEDSGEYIIRIFNLSDKEIVLTDSKWTVSIISN